jgi:hypothetical protein
MANKTLQVFDECKITETHVKSYDRSTGALATGKATKLGCTGKLEISSEYKTIVKNCEGVEQKSVKKITKLTGTISVHMPLVIARTVFGLSNDGLKVGVYGISDKTNTPDMCLTTKAIDLFTDEEKYICLPKIAFTTGFAKSIDNTLEEVAEVELEFNAYKDENNEFYYEACASEVDKTSIGDKWLEEFTPSMVKASSV